MPDTTSPIIHLRWPDKPLGPAACGEQYGGRTGNPGEVTCFACRRTPVFQIEQAKPLPQRIAPPPLTPPVKLSGVMAEDPYLRDLAARARAEGIPQYEHDCSDCEYLGSTLRFTGYAGATHRVELYWCHAPEEGNVLARTSSSPMDYVSGLSAAQHDPDLALAVVRAIHKGLFAANALHFL